MRCQRRVHPAERLSSRAYQLRDGRVGLCRSEPGRCGRRRLWPVGQRHCVHGWRVRMSARKACVRRRRLLRRFRSCALRRSMHGVRRRACQRHTHVHVRDMLLSLCRGAVHPRFCHVLQRPRQLVRLRREPSMCTGRTQYALRAKRDVHLRPRHVRRGGRVLQSERRWQLHSPPRQRSCALLRWRPGVRRLRSRARRPMPARKGWLLVWSGGRRSRDALHGSAPLHRGGVCSLNPLDMSPRRPECK